MQQDRLTFYGGVKAAIPIALGYISVAFAFGMLAMEYKMPIWSPVVISITSFTGTGQFVGIDLFKHFATISEITFTLLIINLRYMLMSLSLSQKLSTKVTFWQRLLIAFGITDENYVVAMGNQSEINFKYMMGIILCSYSGWVGGTIVGAVASSALPLAVRSALGIAMYAMFIAIIVPPAKTSKPIAIVATIAIVMSSCFRWVPFLNLLSSGWIIIICGIVSSAVGAYFFPIKDENEDIENGLQ